MMMQRVNKLSAIHFKAKLLTLRGHKSSCAIVVVTDGIVKVNGVTVLKPVPNPKVKEMLVHEKAFRVVAMAWEHRDIMIRRDTATRNLAMYVK